MTLIVVIPSILALLSATLKGFRPTLVYLTLPCLLLLPAYYSHKFDGVPIVNFHNYTLAITLAAALVTAERKLLRFQGLDFLVLGFVFLTAWSEFENKGFAEGRNLFAMRCMGTLAPYWLGKMVARHNGLLCGVLVSMVGLGAFIGAISIYEARMGLNPFDFLRPLWPTSLPWESVLYRFGLRRVAGPFAHPICQGFFFSMILPLAWWLWDRKLIRGGFARAAVFGGLGLGLLTSGSRGPWMGALLAMGMTGLFWRRDRRFALTLALVAALIIPLLGWGAFEEYVSVGRSEASSQSQETAAYRWETLQVYLGHVAERPLLGYGKNQFPIVNRLDSIDNQYLWLALIHGIPASLLFLCSMIIPAGLLLRRSFRSPHDDPLARLGIAMAAALIGAVLTQLTVFAGTQTEQILFLLIGAAVALAPRVNTPPQPIRSETL